MTTFTVSAMNIGSPVIEDSVMSLGVKPMRISSVVGAAL